MNKSILKEADELVNGERNADYGHPLDDFTRTGKMWAAILGHKVTAEQVGLCMIALKISRECNKPKRDNMLDAAGYAQTVEMCKDERDRRNDAQDTFGSLPFTYKIKWRSDAYYRALEALDAKATLTYKGSPHDILRYSSDPEHLTLTLRKVL